ncbi:PD-(D/E)XK nuclease family protein [Sulfurimonas aquatica]|uniref:PD-(D/E)XK nuclease family protein n=1 Tax=Sulfurimonas aquatica TaxID=2672570 RepID=A0A975GDJ8_9BACT|nr:PD-(D/E)XK nuclease family protein [Sulfurimonas aquatica]QSZ42801.1 PD-(D/E)XK nuclease family protein [Sulfurimonas aquatica]
MDETTIVLPSARAIRHEQLSLEEETLFLPNYITMSDFISKLCIVKGYKYIDDDSRVLLLLEASDFKEFSNLQIERNFFTFTKNSTYIFKFFAELSAEMYEIENLLNADTYAEYEEHISILQELYKRYEKLCKEREYLDKIFLPKLYEFNDSYAKTHSSITIKVDGHLTNFEFELLEKCTQFCRVELVFTTSQFNSKMQSRFEELGIRLESGYEYKISLNEKDVSSKEKIVKNTNVSCESFSESIIQVAFVKNKIYEFVKKGYQPENIAVILPNEKMADTLKSFDDKSNLNLAMGESFSKSEIYKQLNASLKEIEQDSKENYARVERVGREVQNLLLGIFGKKASEFDFIELLQTIQELISNKRELKVFAEEVHSFKKVIPFMLDMSVKSLLKLFLQRLAARSLDDVRGGKVTVMGVLETRSVKFDAVIIVDFDDKNVPKRSDKDMFLNSQVRENANLPTMSDRENLQRHYYEMLINSSKEVAISFVASSESSASRFLKQLGIKDKNIHEEVDVASLLFTREDKQRVEFEDKIIAYSFKGVELSSTRLKTFLTCKRKYYHKYIQRLSSHIIPKDMPQEHEIGNAVHEALKNLYSKKNFYTDEKELQSDLERELDGVKGRSELDKYLIAIQKKRLRAFSKNEIERFAQGYRVVATEESFKAPYHGMTLMGQIDRVDKLDNDIEVLDYKTGSYTLYNKNNFTEATDFQLEFYHILSGSLGNVTGCGFYDLKESTIIPELFLTEKLSILQSHIKDLLALEEIDTKQCEDIKNCLYCEYKIMCGRE